MASPSSSFSNFPEDVQITILSFLSPAELSSFSCTSRRSASLCSAPALWLAMLHRRWGSKTLVARWVSATALPLRRLYTVLDRWESLLGFWRRICNGAGSGTRSPPLVFFEWGPTFISASCVAPSPEAGSYAVVKTPFLWLGLSPQGEPVSFRFESAEDIEKLASDPTVSESDLVPVRVSFMGSNHLVVEENRNFYADSPESGIESTSPPDQLMSEIYQYFANRTSPGDKSSRRQRKKRERERLERRWEAEHFVKIGNYHPTPSRPLQGLWKGICEDMRLDIFLVTYDDIGGISCRRVGDAGEPFSGYSPVFWTSNTTFIKPPFSREEQEIYDNREHIRPVAFDWISREREVVLRILCINSSYDLVLPNLPGSGDPRNVEGRIWEYEDGTFGFGFLRNNHIVDLKHITLDGRLLDAVKNSCNASCS